MTLKEKMDEILEDFDEKDSCPNCFKALKGHFFKNAKSNKCDGDCDGCWNQRYYEEDVVGEIKAIIEETYDAIDSYEKAIVVRTALEKALEEIQIEKDVFYAESMLVDKEEK